MMYVYIRLGSVQLGTNDNLTPNLAPDVNLTCTYLGKYMHEPSTSKRYTRSHKCPGSTYVMYILHMCAAFTIK